MIGSGLRASAIGSRFPPLDPVREARARTEGARFTPPCSSLPSVALRPCVAARSPMSASWLLVYDGGRVYRRARAPLVASFAADAREDLSSNCSRPLHTGVLIANFHRAAPARCGAFADERRVVAGDEGGRVRTRNAYPVPSGSAVRAPPWPACRTLAFPRTRWAVGRRRSCASLAASFAAGLPARDVGGWRGGCSRGKRADASAQSIAWPPTGRGPRRRPDDRRWSANGWRALLAGALIATLHGAAPARCGAFVDERRTVAVKKTRSA
jgi:hypothetical protein